MSRLTQILRNFYIRLEALFGVFFKGLFGFIGKIFSFFAGLFGLTQPDYFLGTDEAQSTKKASLQEPVANVKNATPETFVTSRRRPNSKKIDDYYMNMAREVNKS
ncbi:threonine dehydratase [Nostoc sp. MS1]|uniref:threonine dehydratase n=1 Tax=Nostoc sp. MS1 TaxID=2764711 RepID=UPI001CC82681|nr:threonine dehydratase [Nostoc sp. MS1]